MIWLLVVVPAILTFLSQVGRLIRVLLAINTHLKLIAEAIEKKP